MSTPSTFKSRLISDNIEIAQLIIDSSGFYKAPAREIFHPQTLAP